MSYIARRKSKSALKKGTEPTYTVSNLPSLRRKRTIAYNRISKALEVGRLANTDESQIELFLSYCQEITNISDSFQEAHFIILDLLKDVDESEDDIQERFDETYFQVIAIQRKFEQCSSQQTDTLKRNSLSGSHSGNMRLPKISLPTFAGVIKEWPEFIATYNALIHESTLLSEIEKFHYLVSVLRGDALSLIRTFPVASEHYSSAYDALKSRYEDKRELAFTCWRDILDVHFKTTNAQDFRRALDTIDENLTILKKLHLPTEHWDFVLCYNILAKLDTKLRREFEEKHTDIELPQYKHLRAFLYSKSEALMRDTHFTAAVTNKNPNTWKEASGSGFPQKPKRFNVTHSLIAPAVNNQKKVGDNDKPEAKPTNYSTTPKVIRKCSYCGDEHHISACQDFLAKSLDERMTVAGEKRWCYNCLNPSHSKRDCTSIFSCQKCKRKHHTLLHREQPASKMDPAAGDPASSVALVATESLAQSNSPLNTTVLLATALIQIRDASGEYHTFRALFDTGSQNNFLTAHAAQRLNLQPRAGCANVRGLGGSPASVSAGTVLCDVGANRNVNFRLEMLVLPSICEDQPIARLNTNGWDEVKTLPLADPGFDIPGPIDVLLGADVFVESLLEQRLRGNASQPRAFNSVFGWLLLGKSPLVSSCLLGVASPTVNDSLNQIVQRFWEIDNVPQSSRLTPEEQLCENSFTNDHYRDETGRYVVCLPFKDDEESVFEGSRATALRCFHAIEKCLSRDQNLNQQYVESMSDCTESRHMLRQINVALHHRDYQRILLRAHPDKPLQKYVVNTVTYWVSSAAFLACQTIKQLANEKAKTVLTSDIYVDDIVTGNSSLDDVSEIKTQVIARFVPGSIELRKWVSSRPELLSDLPAETCLSDVITFTEAEDTTIKVLGLMWDPASDSFVFNVNPSNQTCTKRMILREVAKVFDLLGFLSPLIIQAKCLIQKLRVLNVSCDETPLPEIISQRSNFSQLLPEVRELKVPRKFAAEGVQSYQLHGFCDSSEAAYGTVVYLRDTESDGSVRVFLVCAKARVASLQRQSLPHLKVCGVVLLADLIKFVKDSLRIPVHETYLWCDSIVTFASLRALSSRWVKFVANHVSHIQDIVPTECWRHVPSAMNPAAICSRGQLPRDLLNNALWWAGPECLSQSHSEWPMDMDTSKGRSTDNVVLSEQRRRSITIVTNQIDTANQTSTIDQLFKKYSSLDKICRILAYIRRFCNNARNTVPIAESLFITDTERHRALLSIVKHFQNRCFSDVISRLQLPRSFRKLNPFLDEQGILRVGGRLARSGLEFEHKHPALLPRNSVLTTAIIETIHRNNLHPGLNTTHYLILQQFWILWKNEYLHALSQRAKWTEDSKPLIVNSVVLIKDDNRPPLQWALGRVVSLDPWPDEVVGVVTVKPARDHLVKRPLVKPCPLLTE